MKKKIRILVVHGGMTFKNEKGYLHYLKARPITLEKRVYWAGEYLEKSLGKRFHVIMPRMPPQDNAKYRDWKICFERYLALLGNDFMLIGSSLGGIFLAKYLSENKLPTKALATYLVCPPFDNSLPGEDLVGGFILKSNLSLLEENTKKLHLLFSYDDDVVPFAHAEKYQSKLKGAHFVVYKNKNGHFNIPKFPEIVRLITANASSKK